MRNIQEELDAMQEQMIFQIESFEWHERASENVHCLHTCQGRFIGQLGIVRIAGMFCCWEGKTFCPPTQQK